MSRINGDKSRFHRERKQKIARRTRNRKMLKGLTSATKPTSPVADATPKAITA